MKMKTILCTLSLVAGALVNQASHAAPIRTLFLGADTGIANVMNDIVLSDNAKRFDVAGSAGMSTIEQTPTLDYLKQFDSILVWTNYYPQSASALGDVLADYVDAGGLVVRATFVGQIMPAEELVGGIHAHDLGPTDYAVGEEVRAPVRRWVVVAHVEHASGDAHA